ncbi:hypothetical protein B0H14DRAFT_2606632 [Mycena olivaceomarginata]|nr:hypothetical protein B0H14DRAFT_2606632 [Mycena olivaceomarginata]
MGFSHALCKNSGSAHNWGSLKNECDLGQAGIDHGQQELNGLSADEESRLSNEEVGDSRDFTPTEYQDSSKTFTYSSLQFLSKKQKVEQTINRRTLLQYQPNCTNGGINEMGAVTQKVGAGLITRMVALKAAVSLLLKRLNLEAQGAATGDKLNRLNGALISMQW